MGWVDGLASAWGFNLWQYQHPAVGAPLMLLLATLASQRVRERVLAAAARIGAIGGQRSLAWLLVAIPIGLWLLRERRFFGDSTILVYTAMSGSPFAFPELGASYLLGLSMRVGSALGIPGPSVYQMLVCLCGAVAAGSLAGCGQLFATTRSKGLWFAAFVSCGGLARVFAGHVEVYGLVLACGAGYLWAATAYLSGRCRWWLPGAVLGVGVWLHLGFAFFVPSLLALPLLAAPDRSVAEYLRLWSIAGVVALTPTVAFGLAMLAAGHGAHLEAAWTALLGAAGVVGETTSRELWLRGIGAQPGAGTRFAIFSAPHWKYLSNSFFLLAPAAIPVLVLSMRRPGRFWATAQARFLSIAAVSMLTYSAVLRPIWGPYDWDLFCLTALCLAALAGYLMLRALPDPVFSHLGLVAIAATLVFVTIPLLLAGIITPRDAGPFSDAGIHTTGTETPEQAFDRQIGPWL